ncbi:MAG: MBL fold metallo-hydrolase [Clostridia bacterium]|nr:MBL fold metallo-hydrolase [Clostridia bacterium]
MKNENYLAYAQLKDRDADWYGHAPAYDGAGEEELIYSLDTYKSYYVLEHGAGKTDFVDYCNKLEKNNFVLYSSKESNGNSFATYTDGENIVNVSHISYRDVDRYVLKDISYLSIAVDSVKNSMLPPKLEAYESIAKVQVTSIVTCLVIRLADGRFLIVDSSLAREEPVDLIYQTLCEQNVRDGKPIVAAWMITHAHSDHVGGFFGIMEKYGDKIEVQRVIHGFPGEQTYFGKNYMEYTMDDVAASVTRFSNRVKHLMDEKMPNGGFTIAHTGQIFEYPGVTLEIVFTSENLYRQQMFDTNMSSVIYMFTMSGGKLLALGDAVDGEAKIIRKLHGKDLKCDAVVIAHHSFNGGDEELYYNTGASVAIWPNTYEHILQNKLIGKLYNHFDFNSVKHNLILSQDDKVMTLYDGMSVEELARFDRKSDVENKFDVDYELRKQPKNYLTEAHLKEGFGDAPRYYGNGDDKEILTFNETDKTYTITISGVTEYNFEWYCNALKRDGYQSTTVSDDAGKKSATYASLLNSVCVDYLMADSKMIINVGCAGKDVLAFSRNRKCNY